LDFLLLEKKKEAKPLIFYLIFLSIILEIFHLIIPERSFQWADLLGNLLGVVIVIFINNFINIYEISSK
jgi:VanZ family protein